MFQTRVRACSCGTFASCRASCASRDMPLFVTDSPPRDVVADNLAHFVCRFRGLACGCGKRPMYSNCCNRNATRSLRRSLPRGISLASLQKFWMFSIREKSGLRTHRWQRAGTARSCLDQYCKNASARMDAQRRIPGNCLSGCLCIDRMQSQFKSDVRT